MTKLQILIRVNKLLSHFLSVSCIHSMFYIIVNCPFSTVNYLFTSDTIIYPYLYFIPVQNLNPIFRLVLNFPSWSQYIVVISIGPIGVINPKVAAYPEIKVDFEVV